MARSRKPVVRRKPTPGAGARGKPVVRRTAARAVRRAALFAATAGLVAAVSGGVAYVVVQDGGTLSVEAVAGELLRGEDNGSGRNNANREEPTEPPPRGWTRINLGAESPETNTETDHSVAAPPSAESSAAVSHPADDVAQVRRELETTTDSIQGAIEQLRGQLKDMEVQQEVVAKREAEQGVAREEAQAARAVTTNLLAEMRSAQEAEREALVEAGQAQQSMARARALVQQRSQEAMSAIAAAFNAGKNPQTDRTVREAKRRAEEAAQAVRDPEAFIRALKRDAERAAAAAKAARQQLSEAERNAAALATAAREKAEAASQAHRDLRVLRVEVERTREQLLSRLRKAQRLVDSHPDLSGSADTYMLRQFIAAMERRWR